MNISDKAVYFHREFEEEENTRYMTQLLEEKEREPFAVLEEKNRDVHLKHLFQELQTEDGFPWGFYRTGMRCRRAVMSTELFSRQSIIEEHRLAMPSLLDLSILQVTKNYNYIYDPKDILNWVFDMSYGDMLQSTSAIMETRHKRYLRILDFTLPRKRLDPSIERPRLRDQHVDGKTLFSANIPSHTAYGDMKILIYIREIIYEDWDREEPNILQMYSEVAVGAISPVKIPGQEIARVTSLLIDLGESYCHSHFDTNFETEFGQRGQICTCSNGHEGSGSPIMTDRRHFLPVGRPCENDDCPFIRKDYYHLQDLKCAYYNELFKCGVYKTSEVREIPCRENKGEEEEKMEH